MWEKEKLLVTSNFSFSHSVFKRLVLQTRKNQGLFGKGLSHIANFQGHALSAHSLIKKSMKKSMSTVSVREFPEFGELQLCVIANR